MIRRWWIEFCFSIREIVKGEFYITAYECIDTEVTTIGRKGLPVKKVQRTAVGPFKDYAVYSLTTREVSWSCNCKDASVFKGIATFFFVRTFRRKYPHLDIEAIPVADDRFIESIFNPREQ